MIKTAKEIRDVHFPKIHGVICAYKPKRRYVDLEEIKKFIGDCISNKNKKDMDDLTNFLHDEKE